MYVTDNKASDDCNSSSVAIIISVAVTFILTLIVTAIITFIATYICVQRVSNNTNNLNSQSPQEKVLYEEVSLPSHSITKNDLDLQPNPAYGTGNKVVMDTNPAYESYK